MLPEKPRKIAIFGSTGSIGKQALDVLERVGGFEVRLLAARSNWQQLAEQALKWEPEVVVLADESGAESLADALVDTEIRIETGLLAVAAEAREIECDIALNSLVGLSGLEPTLALLERGINIALANKESLVLAGELVTETARRTGAKLLPVDSEHSAIFQCVQGEPHLRIKRLILTASGGPFRNRSLESIYSATPAEALAHPTWSMGPKVTIDSATLMNKGLEVIEAYHLFGVSFEKIEVRIHPVSIVHSMVQFDDGSFKAQLGRPDMRLPIQYALSNPDRFESDILAGDDPSNWPPLEFKHVDFKRYPCLQLAYKALELGGTASAVINGADEVAVSRFLNSEIPFGRISEIITSALSEYQPTAANSLEAVLAADALGRQVASKA